MSRRTRADSVAGALEAAKAGDVSPPSNMPLGGADMAFFKNAIAELPRNHWTAHQVEIAAFLARAMADLQREQESLRKEGFVIDGPNRKTANPGCNIVGDLLAKVLAYRRSLQLHARSFGEARNKAQRIAHDEEAQIDHESDLLARPN